MNRIYRPVLSRVLLDSLVTFKTFSLNRFFSICFKVLFLGIFWNILHVFFLLLYQVEILSVVGSENPEKWLQLMSVGFFLHNGKSIGRWLLALFCSSVMSGLASLPIFWWGGLSLKCGHHLMVTVSLGIVSTYKARKSSQEKGQDSLLIFCRCLQ